MRKAELISVLTTFHREVVIPDVERIVSVKFDALRNEMLTGFDHVYHRLGRLETELVALNGGLHRVENRVEELEKRLNIMAARIEEGFGKVEERLTSVERRLEAVERLVEDQHVDMRAELDDLKRQTGAIRTRLGKIEAPRSRS